MHRAPPRPRPSSVPGDADDLDAVVEQHRVGDGVALVAHDDTGCKCEEVVGVVPLFALSGGEQPTWAVAGLFTVMITACVTILRRAGGQLATPEPGWLRATLWTK